MAAFLGWKHPGQMVMLNLGIALVMYLVLTLNLSFLTLAAGVGAPIWIAAGLAIALLGVWGNGTLPGLAVGVMLFNLNRYLQTPEQSFLWSVMILNQLLEFWLGARFLRRYTRCSPGFESLRDVLVFISLVATVPAAISATVAMLALRILAELPGAQMMTLWQTWFISNATGILVIAPLFLCWSDRRCAQPYRRRDWLHISVITGLATLIAYIAFFRDYPIEYSLLPLLGWATFRFGWREVTSLVTLMTTLAIIGTAQGMGTFARPSVAMSLVLLQSFISVIALSALVLCALVQERTATQRQLEQYNQELERRVAERTASLNQSQRDLSRQQTFLRNVIDTNPSLIEVRDMSDRFVLANRSLAEFYGTSVEALIGCTSEELTQLPPNPEANSSQGPVKDPLLDDVRIYEKVIANAAGEERYFYCLEKPLFLQGSETETRHYLLNVATDISDRKATEQALEQAREAADLANRAKSEFLANMSHELRTPLNGILGYAQILKRNPHSEQQRQGIEIIHQCGSHLLTLINDILDLSKIEARKMELHLSDIYFPAFLTGVSEICQIKAEPKGLAWQYQVVTPIPEAVRTDEKRLRQVLINLLGNAVKYTEAGQVTFQVAVIEHLDEAVKVRFEIRDTGVGMSQEQLERIFQPFEQVGRAREMAEGTGLGLTISQKIVHLMGSQIQVQSQINQGSTFVFDLVFPLAQEWVAPSMTRYGKILGYQGPRRRILVVDDRPENRSVVRSLLEPLGFGMLEAADGYEGYDCALAQQPDLILTDLVMPDSDGFELIQRLRGLSEFRSLPIIVSSASVFEEDRDRSLEFGGSAFLPKPIQAEELFNLLQQLLQLDWQYEAIETPAEATATVSPETFDADAVEGLPLPSREVLAQLLDWARRGNLNRIRGWSNEVVEDAGDCREFAQCLGNLAQRFRERDILSMLQVALESPKV